ncbi:hypothetical protein HGRIS_002926 [Hohenbuehelia grisea]|uniref:Uncharacterized protein n=1 Tax=Hohenbuehelia grisea TaxID=104357 RepID=A0ABR3JNW3_9AGAR
MFWPKRRPSRPGDPSSASQQQLQQQPQKTAIPSSLPSSSSPSSLSLSSTSTSTGGALSDNPRQPLAPLDPQITITVLSGAVPSSTVGFSAQPSFTGSASPSNSHNNANVSGGRKISWTSDQQAIMDSQNQRPTGSPSRSAQGRRASATLQTPLVPPMMTNAYRIQADELSLYKELSTFQFGNPMPSSSSPSASASPSPTTPSSTTYLGADDPDDAISPLTMSDVTPRPSVISYTQAPSGITPSRSVGPNDTPAANVHNQSHGHGPLYSTSSHSSQQTPTGHGTFPSGLPGVWAGADSGMGSAPAQRSPSRDRSMSPSAPNGRDADERSHRTFGENSTSHSHSNASSGFASPSVSSSASASVTSLTSASQSLSSSVDDDGLPAVGGRRADRSQEREARAASEPEFSSEDEYYDEDEDGSSFYPNDEDAHIEVSSVRWEPGYKSQPDSFYYQNAGGAAASGYSFGAVTSTPSLNLGRRGSIPIAIPGASSSDPEKQFQDGANRDREGSIATLRRPSRSLDDDLRTFAGPPSGPTVINAAALGSLAQSEPQARSGWTAMQEKGKGRDSDDTPVPTASDLAAIGDITSFGFDADWGNMRGGITGLTANDIEGLVDPSNQGILAGRRPSNAFNFTMPGIPGLASPSSATAHSPTTGRARMGSWFSLGGRRQSEATVVDDAFIRSVRRWDVLYGARRKDWSFKRENREGQGTAHAHEKLPNASDINVLKDGGALGRASTSRTDTTIGGIFGSRSSIVALGDRSSAHADGERDRERDKDRDKERRSKSAPPKGMTIGTQEIWRNELVGRYRVDRRAAKPVDPLKPPQQRLNFQHLRESHRKSGASRPGPPVTVHKHSKAIAFSISRMHAKLRSRRDAPGTNTNGVPTTPRGRTQTYAGREGTALPRSSMIMLAPRRVQEQYTSTTTTRRLDTHGLLEDALLGFSVKEVIEREKERDRSVSRRERREKEREREAEKERERERERRRKAEDEDRKKRSRAGGDSSQTSSASSSTSVVPEHEPYTTPPPASAPSLHTYPPPPNDVVRKHSSSHSLRGIPGIPEQPPPLSNLNPSAMLEYTQFMARKKQRRAPQDPLAFDSDEEQGPPSRTPHAEAYGTIDPSSYDRILHQQQFISDNTPSLLRRFLGLPSLRSANNAASPLSASLDGTFKAPWLTMAPRAKQEEQERVVAILNESFMDVGLLPSRPSSKSKASSHSSKAKSKQRQHGNSPANDSSAGVNIFEQVPSDSLYMLLPLWPGETDPISEKLPAEPKKPVIPIEDRQYLLVYYVSDAVKPAETDRAKHDGEQRSQKKSRSPTASDDIPPKHPDNKNILLSAFHVSARLVGYSELIGSGVRVPDEGLSVTGPMSEALETMPSPEIRQVHQGDFLIGLCQSRDAGMEFFPEGLVKMGLCIVISPPPRDNSMPPDETEEAEEPDIVLSPIGRAAVEMVWVGCMALTSFGPTMP